GEASLTGASSGLAAGARTTEGAAGATVVVVGLRVHTFGATRHGARGATANTRVAGLLTSAGHAATAAVGAVGHGIGAGSAAVDLRRHARGPSGGAGAGRGAGHRAARHGAGGARGGGGARVAVGSRARVATFGAAPNNQDDKRDESQERGALLHPKFLCRISI